MQLYLLRRSLDEKEKQEVAHVNQIFWKKKQEHTSDRCLIQAVQSPKLAKYQELA